MNRGTGVMESHGGVKGESLHWPAFPCFKRHSIQIPGRWKRTPKGSKTQTKRTGIGLCHHTPRTWSSGRHGPSHPPPPPPPLSLSLPFVTPPSIYSIPLFLLLYLFVLSVSIPQSFLHLTHISHFSLRSLSLPSSIHSSIALFFFRHSSIHCSFHVSTPSFIILSDPSSNSYSSFSLRFSSPSILHSSLHHFSIALFFRLRSSIDCQTRGITSTGARHIFPTFQSEW